MVQVTWHPAPAVTVDKVLTLTVVYAEHPDPDTAAMVQARNGSVLHTDLTLLACPEDRMRYTAELIVRANGGLDPMHVEGALQLLYGEVHKRLAQIAPQPEEPKEVPWPEALAPEAYYGLAGDFVRAVEPHTEADPVGILLQFLVAFGNAAGRGPHALVERTRHGVNEYVCLVGDTAKARKGTSVGHVVDLFRAAEAQQDPLALAMAGPWADARIKNGLASGEGFIWQVRDPIEKTEPVKDPKTKQMTSFQRVVVDEGEPDKRLLVLEGELAATLKVLQREGNTLSPALRNAWDGVRLAIMTKNFPATASDTHISIIGHITKTELKREMAEVEGANGFANRFLWGCVKRSKELPDGGSLADADLAPLVSRLDAALMFAQRERRLVRDADAAEIWRAVYHDLSEGKDGLLGDVTARAEAHVLRLSCLYALLDCSDVVRADHLLAALAVWKYCEQSAAHIFGDMSGSPTLDRLTKALESSGTEGMTRTEISKLFQGHAPAAKIQQALDELLNAGKARRIHEAPEAGKGRMIERWFAVPPEATA